MQNIRTIASHWAEFNLSVITADTPAEERALARASFYAGSDRMLELMLELVSGSLPGKIVKTTLDNIHAELMRFNEGIAEHASEPPKDAGVRLIQAVLLFHRGGPWTPDDARMWREYTGREETTTKTLCDFAREVMDAKPAADVT